MAAPAAGKRCAGQLRYAHLADWVVPVSFYFVEGLSANKWVIARPPCHPDEEDAPEEHQVSVESVWNQRGISRGGLRPAGIKSSTGNAPESHRIARPTASAMSAAL